LKNVKNGIISNKVGEMKIPVLKALANPAYIFFVPYNLAVFNFMVHLIVYVFLFFGALIITGGMSIGGNLGNIVIINPLYFAISLITVHMILAGFSKKEPFILRIFMARLKLFKMRVPKELHV